ncbi:penicillin acylase family protein [Georgenia satyanarayanai]|uniref:penicillin acylase family protein n=1 Tax=Georgenia satyanarayanai TaxID=860221 RepID=UPI002041E788|nr:penicillin acylase family protein [Georgenia satyanarayanai]MCM3662239.1 penicillin acylase family protein [Georgenia satyanarayanai]
MRGSHLLQRLTIVVAAVLVVILVAGVALAAVLVRRPLPDYGGETTLRILSSQVEVLRDERGVPQIYADTDTDLMRGQGYVHAQDRFFEMDYRRHVTAGRVSELVGENENALAADRVIRTLGWRRVAEQEWDLLSEESRALFEAYAEGVNAYLDSREASQLGVEYTVLGLVTELGEVAPWTPIDSLAWLKAMAWDLAANNDQELGRATAVRALGGDVSRVAQLYPAYPETRNLPIIPPPEATEPEATVEDASWPAPAGAVDAIESAYAAVQATPRLLGDGDGIGSNSFVVSGEHTVGGQPILANDPHLGISAPGVWHQVGLHCRELTTLCTFDVAGFDFAGMPGIIIGHNAELAWGLTNLGADVVDFFLERVYDDGTYLRGGERVPLTRRTETIAVNGGTDDSLTVAATAHGPIVSGVLPETAAANSSPVPDGSPSPGFGGYAVAMSWTALTPGRTGDAIFALNRAATAEDVAAAAALFEVPAQNIVFATTDGDIGYQAPGRIPVRQEVSDGPVPSDGSWPRPGWDGRYDWAGYVPAADMPSVLNPEEGFIVAANQAVLPAGQGPFLTGDWDYGFRSQRLRERLTATIERGVSVDASLANEMMNDEANPYAEALVPALLDVTVTDGFVQEAVDLLAEWEAEGYQQDGDSAAAAYFAAVWANLLDLTFADDLPATLAPDGGSRWLVVVDRLLEDPTSEWWDDRRTINLVESRDEILLQALVAARNELTQTLGKDPGDWRWSQLHVAAPQHPVLGDGVPAVVSWFANPRPVGVGGGSSIVNATGWDASAEVEGRRDYGVTSVPSMRMAVDLADFDRSLWVNFTGVSGHPADDHYDDQLGAWAAGETFAWPFSPAAVEDAATSTRTLRHPG